jgi:PilZ domain
MNEKRRDERVPLEVEVEVTVPGLFWRKKRILRTRDLSHNGVFVTCDGRQCPAVGTEIEIRLTGLVEGQDPPVVRARIVRIVEEGMAIQFLGS